MTLVGRSALLHRGTYVRDRNVRFYKARYEEDPDDKPRSSGPASSLQLERAGAAVQDLLYALLMLDSLLDAGPPSSPQECIERARHLELGREHQKYLAGRRADLKLGREPKAEPLPEVVGVEEEKRPQTPPPPPARPPGAATPAAEAIAAMPASTPEERKEKATKTFGGMLSAARGFMRSGSRERKTRPKRGAWQRPSSRENSSRESSAERSRPGSRESSVVDGSSITPISRMMSANPSGAGFAAGTSSAPYTRSITSLTPFAATTARAYAPHALLNTACRLSLARNRSTTLFTPS